MGSNREGARTGSPIPTRQRAVGSWRPGVESLESRTLLSVAAARTTAFAVPTPQENQAYIAGLIGTSRALTPQEVALGQKLTAELNAGVSRQQVVTELIDSAPARGLRVQTTFQRLLHRLPTTTEQRVALQQLQRGYDERALVVKLVGTPAYRQARGHGTNAGIVTSLYQDILQRDPTATELRQGLNGLKRGVSTTTLARRLMNSLEAETLLIKGVHGLLGPQSPGVTPRDLAELARPNGLDRLTARVLANDLIFQQILSPATTLAPLTDTVDDHPPGFPIPPGFDLNSRVQPLDLSQHFLFFEMTAIGVGSDDIPWFGTAAGLLVYDLTSGTRTPLTSLEGILGISALNANEAYVLAGPENTPSMYHVVGKNASPLPALPGGDLPAQIAASNDGLVWALGTSNTLYSYASAPQTWSTIPTNGFTLKEITIGSATNIWALTTGGAGLRYTPGTGFQVDTFLASNVTAVQATSDGAVWAVGEGFVFMKPSFGVWKLAPKQPPTFQLSYYFVAGSMNRAYQVGLLSGDQGEVVMISVGVADRQPIPFPTFTGAEQDAYLALSQAALITNPAGVRATYNTPGGDWGGLQSKIATAVRPANIPVNAWTSVQNQLTTELLEIGTVYGRLQLIQDVMAQIQVVNDGALGAAASVVGLSQPYGSDKDTIIRLVLEAVFEAIAGSISSTGIPPAGAVVAAMLASGFSSAISAYESSNPPGPDNTVPIQYSNLATQMDQLFLQSIAQINTDITSIVGDYGKLSAVSLAILNGQWPYINQTSSQIAAAATDAFNQYFYQSLIAVRWQVLRSLYGDYIKYPIQELLHGLPSYDIYQVPDGYQNGMPIEKVYVVNKLGGTTDFNSINLGDIPVASMFTNLQALPGTAYNDFWVGNGNWAIIKRIAGTLG